ncbi:MAG: polysaccharide deacetylase family protein [Nitrospirae bacterium]|nr:polysaccharide deacetylase family protein [Nitrospirota bacterium]
MLKFWRGLVRKTSGSTARVVILMYHRVLPDISDNPFRIAVTEVNFAAHMSHLAKNYPVISMDEFERQHLEGRLAEKKQVVISFDDGYADNFTYALPVLKNYNLPAIFYVATDYIGGNRLFWWDEVKRLVSNSESLQIGNNVYDLSSSHLKKLHLLNIVSWFRNLSVDERERMLSLMHHRDDVWLEDHLTDRPMAWHELDAMLIGGMLIGSHSCKHPSLGSISENDARHEVLESKRVLASRLNVPIKHFSYPYDEKEVTSGSVMPVPRKIVMEAGMKSAVTTVHGYNTTATDVFSLKRMYIDDWDQTLFIENINYAFE